MAPVIVAALANLGSEIISNVFGPEGQERRRKRRARRKARRARRKAEKLRQKKEGKQAWEASKRAGAKR
jgi:hypothetical protein